MRPDSGRPKYQAGLSFLPVHNHLETQVGLKMNGIKCHSKDATKLLDSFDLMNLIHDVIT